MFRRDLRGLIARNQIVKPAVDYAQPYRNLATLTSQRTSRVSGYQSGCLVKTGSSSKSARAGSIQYPILNDKSDFYQAENLKICSLCAALVLVSCSSVQTTDDHESIAYGIGRAGRQFGDYIQSAEQATASATQQAHDWFISSLSEAGESLSGVTNNVGGSIDLFFYGVRHGYEQGP